MSKKLYAAAAPLLAFTAFALMPAVVAAAPHWYKCEHGTAKTHKWTDASCSVENIATEGEYERVRLPFEAGMTKTRITTSGVLTPRTTSLAVELKCYVDGHGKIWNTTLVSPGLGEFNTFENYECESVPSTFCTGTVTMTASGLPWGAELAVIAGVIRDKIKGISLTTRCSSPLKEWTATGELSPKVVNGTVANGGATVLDFDTPGSGSLTGTAGEETFTGELIVQGVESAEVIDVFNP
jgi:hypothetical protein